MISGSWWWGTFTHIREVSASESLAETCPGSASTDLCHWPKRTHLLQDNACGQVDCSPDAAILSRVADEGPHQHGHHDQAHGTVTYQGEGGQADEEQHAGQHVEETHQDKQHRRGPKGTEQIFRLWGKKKNKKKQKQKRDYYNGKVSIVLKKIVNLSSKMRAN